ncbi:MAG: hypothetical protein R3F42_10730 [Pseudomonadota bacterium]
MKAALTLAATTAILLLGGCAASLVYDSGRSWKQRECYKIPDRGEQRRCLQSTALSYEEYRRTLAQEQSR